MSGRKGRGRRNKGRKDPGGKNRKVPNQGASSGADAGLNPPVYPDAEEKKSVPESAGRDRQEKGRSGEKSLQKKVSEKREGLNNYDYIAQYFFAANPLFMVYLINYAFGTHFTEEAMIAQLRTVGHFEGSTGKIMRLIGDMLFEIREGSICCSVLQEIESTWSRWRWKIKIRIRNYLLQFMQNVRENEKAETPFPQAFLILLRSNRNTPRVLKLSFSAENGKQKITLSCPVICVDKLSVEDLFKHRLYLLIPFYLLKYRDLGEIEADDSRLKALEKEFIEIRKRLNEDKELSDGDVSEICHMICRVSDYYCAEYKKIREVFHVNFWDVMAKDERVQAFRKAVEQGRAEGLAEGRTEGIKEGIAKERAASRKKLRKAREESRESLMDELSMYVRTSKDKGLSDGEILECILSGDSFPRMG